MKKLLRPKDILLLGLGNVLDLFEEAKDPFALMANSYKQICGWVPRKFKRHNFAYLVRRQLKTKKIVKVEKGGEMYICLTGEGKESLKREFPLFHLAQKRWDGKWRIVIFDIAETSKRERNVLRTKLKELGFGMLQKSVWLTPHDLIMDLKEFIESQRMEESVIVMEVSYLLAGDPRVLADKIWNLEELNQKYSDIIDEATKLTQSYVQLDDRSKKYTVKLKRPTSVMREAIEDKLTFLKRKYLQVLMSDPYLPQELLPSEWIRRKALERLKTVV